MERSFRLGECVKLDLFVCYLSVARKAKELKGKGIKKEQSGLLYVPYQVQHVQ
jgi:hypothetical protein